MELLCFGRAGAKVLVFPTRQGRFFDYENWGLVDSIRPSIENGHLQLFCVDSVDSESLYCERCPSTAKIARHNQYERYILDEVAPMMRSRSEDPFLIAHGCSIGAYHALNIGFRHPEVFGKVVAFSGRFDLTRPVGPFADLFNGYYDQDIYFHTPAHFLPSLSCEQRLAALRRMQILLAVGAEDPFVDSNHQVSRTLWDKQIPHTLAIWDGEAHRASAWRQMARHYL